MPLLFYKYSCLSKNSYFKKILDTQTCKIFTWRGSTKIGAKRRVTTLFSYVFFTNMSVLLVEELCWDLFLPQKADLFVVIALVTLILLWNLCPEKNPTIFGDSGILIQHFPLSLSPPNTFATAIQCKLYWERESLI